MQDRINHVTRTKPSRDAANSKKTNYYEKLKKAEIKFELRKRELLDDTADEKKKAELEEILKEHLHGAHRVPALIFNYPMTPLEELNLQYYEFLPVEPLHALTGHIRNLYEEIPEHLDTKNGDKKYFEMIKKASFCGKEVKNGSDYRESLINIVLHLQQERPNFPFYELLSTLCEIQEILYQNESDRTIQTILRLHNVTFKHFLIMHRQLDQPSSLTPRKLSGQYFHSLTIHAPQQL